MNAKGTKFLAVFAVFAMVVSAFAFVAPVAAGAGDQGDVYGFAAGQDEGDPTNIGMGNQIFVTVEQDETVDTIKIEGKLGYIPGSEAADKWAALWASGKAPANGFIFKIPAGLGQYGLWETPQGDDIYIKGYDTTSDVGMIRAFGGQYTEDIATIYLGNVKAGEALENGLEIKEDATHQFSTYKDKLEVTKTIVFDLSGLEVLGEDDEKVTPCVAFPGQNALVDGVFKGVGINGGTWSLSGTTLTLENYDGNQYFSGAFETLILKGENKIALENKSAITSSEALEIKSQTGYGALEIEITKVANGAKAISAAGLEINNGVVLRVSMEQDQDKENQAYVGIDGGAADLKVFNSHVTVQMGEDSESAVGIDAGTVEFASSEIMVDGNGIAIDATTSVKVRASDVDVVAGNIGISAGSLEVVSGSNVIAESEKTFEDIVDGSYGIVADTILIESESVVNAYGVNLKTGDSQNFGTLNLYDLVLIQNGATLKNSGILNITEQAKVLVIGALENVAGKTTNLGQVTTSIAKPTATGTLEFKMPDEIGEKMYVGSVEFSNPTLLADGTVKLKAEVKLKNSAGTVTGTIPGVAGTAKFDELAIRSFDGIITSTDGNNMEHEFAVVISSKVVKDSEDNFIYTVEIDGEYYNNSKELVVNVSTSCVDTAESNSRLLLGVLGSNDKGTLAVSGGEFIGNVKNDKQVTVTGGLLKGDIEGKGALTVGGGNVAASAQGDVAVNGDVTVSKSGSIIGNIITEGKVTITGGGTKNATVNGNITAEGTVTVGDKGILVGDITAADNQTYKISGTMNGNIIYSGKYKSSDKIEDGKEDLQFTSQIVLAINGNGASDTEIQAVAAGETVPGYLKLTNAGAVAKGEDADGKEFDLYSTINTVTGEFQIDCTAIPDCFFVTIEKDTVGSVVKNKTVDVKGVLAFADGVKIGVYEKVDGYKDFGKVTSETKYNDAGYTNFASFKYALGHISDGKTLELTADAYLFGDVAVGNGIIITIADDKKLYIGYSAVDAEAKTKLTMGEGSKIVLGGDKAKVFVAPFDGGAAGNDDDINVIVSGTFGYDINTIELSAAEFEAQATIVAVKATTKDPSSIGITATYNTGAITAAAGVVSGQVELKKTMEDGKVKTFAILRIDEGATVTAKVIAAQDTAVCIDGILKVTADLSINTEFTGTGKIVLKSGTITVGNKAANTNKAVLAVDVVTEDGNGLAFAIAMNNGETGGDYRQVDNTFTLAATAAKSDKPSYITLAGTDKEDIAYSGIIEVIGNAYLKNAVIPKDLYVMVPADAALTIDGTAAEATEANYSVKADGVLAVMNGGVLNMWTEDTKTYAGLYYQVSFDIEGGIAYSALATAVEAGVVKEFYIDSDLTIDNDDGLIVDGVSLVIAEDAKIKINTFLVVGAPKDSLAATSSIEGTIELSAQAFIISYPGAVIDSEDIVSGVPGGKIVSSEFVLGGSEYAIVYANQSVGGAGAHANDVTKQMDVKIDGYRFVDWLKLDTTEALGGEGIGTVDYEAKIVAKQIEVIFKSVPGVTYFVDNKAMHTLDAPVKLAYGSIVTAVADVGYEGTPLVNGQKYISINDTTKDITASGVSPVQPKQDGGMGLTDILLIVLVVLVVVLAVVVILRLNRS